MLVATRSFTALYDGGEVEVTPGVTRVAADHPIAVEHPDGFEHDRRRVGLTSRDGSEYRVRQPGDGRTEPLIDLDALRRAAAHEDDRWQQVAGASRGRSPVSTPGLSLLPSERPRKASVSAVSGLPAS